MDISLIVSLKCFRSSTHFGKTHIECLKIMISVFILYLCCVEAGTLEKLRKKSQNLPVFLYKINMDISLIVSLKCFRSSTHFGKTHIECLKIMISVFILYLCCVEAGTLEKLRKKSQNLPVFLYKISTRA